MGNPRLGRQEAGRAVQKEEGSGSRRRSLLLPISLFIILPFSPNIEHLLGWPLLKALGGKKRNTTISLLRVYCLASANS